MFSKLSYKPAYYLTCLLLAISAAILMWTETDFSLGLKRGLAVAGFIFCLECFINLGRTLRRQHPVYARNYFK